MSESPASPSQPKPDAVPFDEIVRRLLATRPAPKKRKPKGKKAK